MSKRLYFLAAAALLFQASSAWAVREAKPIATDNRIQTVMYNSNEIFKFTGHYGFQSSIEFEADETIQTISLGNSLPWMLNPVGNRLFLKPIEADALTNMTLITNKRVYYFELHAEEADNIDDKGMIFAMRFLYGADDNESGISNYLDQPPSMDVMMDNPGKYNFNYTVSGTEDIAPIRIFDDGEFTYFEFRDKNAEVPAFFLVNAKGEESIINFRTRGDYIVVERVGSRFTLRSGDDVVCVFNEARPLGQMKR